MTERDTGRGSTCSIGELIRERCPGWVVDRVELLGGGDFSTAYLVNGEWVFRFAKHEQAAASLKREACLLTRIAGQFDVDVPSPEVVSVQASPAFTAYRMLPGPALTKERYLALPAPDRDRCAGELARFLVQMHATDAGRARACGIQAGDYAARYAGVLAAAREQLFAHLGAAERSFVEASVEDFLTSHAESELRPVVLHGDLSPDHVLYDEASRSISGVIDFGDVVIGDPAWDLVYLYEDYGVDLLGRFLPAYPSSDPRRLLERAYRFSVLDLIEWAVRCANEGSPELEEATSELIVLRGSGERREELLSLVR